MSKNLKFTAIIYIITITLLLIDRLYWAQISQWREDQATNMWLGYTSKITESPVGLISSAHIPNPNGMIILGSFLSILPNLLTVSLFLAITQAFLIYLVGVGSFKNESKYLLFAIVPGLLSVVLRSISVEHWNQFTITLINIFFIYWAKKYLDSESPWSIPPITALILFAPALYLAGLVNAIVMAMLMVLLFIYKKPRGVSAGLVLTLLVLVFCSIASTWYPYFENVAFEQIFDYKKQSLGLTNAFQSLWNSFWNMPSYATMQWGDNAIFTQTIKHADPKLLSFETQFLLKLVGKTYLLQAAFAFTTFAFVVLKAIRNVVGTQKTSFAVNASAAKLVALSGLFVILSYGISTWVGGPEWINGERADQTVQFLPMFLLIIFLIPITFSVDGSIGKIINTISYVSLTTFSFVNLICGYSIIRDHLQYRGNVLTEADVPLIHKMQAIEFIATDWKKHSNSNVISVDYDLGGKRWDWVPEFGMKLLPWYPAPMTQGRSFDYDLLRQYGLVNKQEGVQLRTFGTGRYLITYSFADPPMPNADNVSHYLFGRIRVSVVDQ